MIKITLDASLCASGENLLLMSMMYDLQEEFEEAIRMTEDTFEARDLPGIIDYLEVHVKSLLGLKTDHQTELAQTVGEEFHHCQQFLNCLLYYGRSTSHGSTMSW